MPPAPFVNAELMQRYMNNNVRIVGGLVADNGMEVTICTSDGKNVKVRTQWQQRMGKRSENTLLTILVSCR